MRKTYLYIAGLIAITVFSCTDDTFEKYSNGELRITGNMSPDSRISYVQGDGVMEVHWKKGDEIALFTNNQSNLCYEAYYAGKSTEFKKNYRSEELIKEEDKTVYAFYPHDYPDNKTVGLDSVYMGIELFPCFYSQAQIKNGELNFQFKTPLAYLKIEVPAKMMNEIVSAANSDNNDEKKDYSVSDVRIRAYSDSKKISIRYGYFNLKTQEISGGLYLAYEDGGRYTFSSENTYTYFFPILPQPKGTTITIDLRIGMRGDEYYRYGLSKLSPDEGFQAGHVYHWTLTGAEDKKEENLVLLKSFYEKTGGSQWWRNDNWLSDKPLSDWYAINDEVTGNFICPYNHIQKLYLHYNNLTGPFPEEVAEIMDQIIVHPDTYGGRDFDLNMNNLYGPIPDVVKNHKRWNELGWMCVVQNFDNENELDLTNSNLYVENVRVEDLFSDENSVKELYEIFKENKLTQITGSDFSGDEMQLNKVYETFIDKRVNQHLDYESKGLKTLFFLGDGTEEEIAECKNGIYGTYGNVNGITWLKGKNNNANQYRSASYFYDSNGQLVYVAEHNPTCPTFDEDLLVEKTDKFLRSVLGEPVEHPEFKAEYYTSTDYSRDGEVVTLQEATEGNGINLIFMGEAFVDKDMEPGGLYEQTMKKAMEQFFIREPYKSFRNRFNVYAIKAVSANSAFVDGASHAINHNNKKCFEYAQKIENPNDNPLMVTVIYRDFIWTASMSAGSTKQYEDGSFVAYIYTSTTDTGVLMHEAGGHGFGQLWDEYIGIESALSESSRAGVDNMWNNWGIGANVDWRNDRSTVKWSHFLNDSRYENEELGIFEGALYRYGIYRPSYTSMMSNASSPFNAPSREHIYKRIMQRSEGADWKYDYEEFVKYDEINRKSATRAAVRPLSEAEKKEYAKKHCPPTLIKGTWRDEMKNGKSNTVVPLR